VKKYAMVYCSSDSEVYLDLLRGQFIKFVWGYSTGSDTGIHNEFNTDVCVFQRTGDDDDWVPVAGFNVVADDEGNVDWADYEAKVDEVLAWL